MGPSFLQSESMIIVVQVPGGIDWPTWVIAAFAAASFATSFVFYRLTRRLRQPKPIIVGGIVSYSKSDAALDVTLQVNNPGEMSIFIQHAVVTHCRGQHTVEKPMPSFNFYPQILLPHEVGDVTWREPAAAFSMCQLHMMERRLRLSE